jgi:hypothetical protein
MSIFWTIVVYVFVLGTLGAVTLGVFRMFGGGRPQH